MPSTPSPNDGAQHRHRAALVAVAVGALVWMLTACTAPAPAESPRPSADASASAEPIFASDEEALAAAVAAYEAYLAVDQGIAADGGRRPERILEVATADYGDQLIAEFNNQFENGVTVTGESRLGSSRLAEWSDGATTVVTIYGCLDASATRIIDHGGVDRTPPDRDTTVPLVLSFEATGREPLKLSGSELWSGDDFC